MENRKSLSSQSAKGEVFVLVVPKVHRVLRAARLADRVQDRRPLHLHPFELLLAAVVDASLLACQDGGVAGGALTVSAGEIEAR